MFQTTASQTTPTQVGAICKLCQKKAKGLQSVQVFSSTAPEKNEKKSHNAKEKRKGDPLVSLGIV